MLSMLPSLMLMGLTAAVEEAAGPDDDALLVIAKWRSLATLVAAIIVHGARIGLVKSPTRSGLGQKYIRFAYDT